MNKSEHFQFKWMLEADETDIQNVIDIIIQKEGKIDVLWNNAGYALYGSVEETPIAEARRQFEVNLFGLASLTQKVIPHMRKSKKVFNHQYLIGWW